jgi:hypothetical protein
MILMNKLPFIMAILITVIIGIISYDNGAKTGNIYLRMLLSFSLFYILGLYARSEITKIIDAVNKQKLESETSEKFTGKQENKAQVIDYTIGEDEEKNEYKDGSDNDFVPLKVSQVIRNTIRDEEGNG